MNHTVNILPYVVVDFVGINRARENACLSADVFIFFNAFWWLNHVAVILFCEKLPFLSYPQNLDWGLLTRTLAARCIVVVEGFVCLFFQFLTTMTKKNNFHAVGRLCLCFSSRLLMDGGENTEKDTRPVLQQNNYLDFICTQQLLLGSVLGEIAATFFCTRARTGRQQCGSVCVFANARFFFYCWIEISLILCIKAPPCTYTGFILAASLDLTSWMLKLTLAQG